MVHAAPPPFVEAIRDALAGADIARARARWSAHPPAPWHAWLLVALARQVSAQRWAMRIWRGPLAVAVADAEYHDVPRMRGWSYQIQRRRLSLMGPDAEILEVDDRGDDEPTIHAHCFTTRLVSFEEPALPERRLLELLPFDLLIADDDLVGDAIEQVAATGLLQRGERALTFRISPALEDMADALAAVDFSAAGARDRWAEHMGDHLLLADARAPAQRRDQLRYFMAGIERLPIGFLVALEGRLPPDELVATYAKILDGPIGATTGTALDRLAAHPDYPVCPAVARVLERADPAIHYPYPIYVAARYLLRRGLDRALAVRVARVFAEIEVVPPWNHNPILDDLALLLLEHAPAHALPLIRRGLRAGDSGTQRKLATALALLDQPWCHRELLRALNEATTFEGTPALRAALLRSSAPGAQEVVRRWEQTHVQLHPPETNRPPRTWVEKLEARAGKIFDHEAKDLRPWAEAVRPSIDPDFDRVALA